MIFLDIFLILYLLFLLKEKKLKGGNRESLQPRFRGGI